MAVATAFNPSTGKSEAGRSGFENSLEYRACSRTARDTRGNCLQKTKSKAKQKICTIYYEPSTGIQSFPPLGYILPTLFTGEKSTTEVNFPHVPQVVMLKLEFKITEKCLEIGNRDSSTERGILL